MKITNGIKIAACSLLMSACSGNTAKYERAFREVRPTGTTAKILRETAQRSKEGLDKTYIIFGRDTLYIGDKYEIKADKILTKLSNYANNRAVIKSSGYKRVGDSFERVNIRIFNNTRGVINSNKVYQTPKGFLYVPVEFYGKK